jgi:hypothetical protein
MRCTCHSYNWDIGETPEVVVMHHGKSICLDACIADEIQYLWAKGIETLGSCCGHNRERPSVILSGEMEISGAREILRASDKHWKILIWRLTDVTEA